MKKKITLFPAIHQQRRHLYRWNQSKIQGEETKAQDQKSSYESLPNATLKTL